MKIIFNNEEKEIRLLTYFKYGSSSSDKEFVLYTENNEDKERKIYLSEIEKTDAGLKFILPSKENLIKLKKIIKNFISKDFELSIVLQNKFKYLDIKNLEQKNIEEIENKTIILTKEQYIKLISNKYLTYPKMEILNMDEITKEGYDKNNKEAIPASLLTLLIYLIGILIFQIILSFNGIPVNTLFKPNGPSIIVWSLVIAIISMIAFNYEEKRTIESWLIIFIITITIILIISLIQNNFQISRITLNSLIYSLLFLIPYTLSKKISFKIVNKLKCRNYLTYYCFYLVLFILVFIPLINLYNKVLINYINNIIEMM
ncbi:MAG: hypothetical protein J6K21_05750 [Bacilli bacterium]|nr:hypothetical protein [Bacilli bacterium]